MSEAQGVKLISPEDIMNRAQREGRELSGDDLAAMTAAETDRLNDEAENGGRPPAFKYYRWIELHNGNRAPLYLVSSIRDALAFESLGFSAMEYRRGNMPDLLEDVRMLPPERPLYIALSKRNRSEAKKLQKELAEAGLKCFTVNPYGSEENALQAFQKDPERLRSEIERIQKDPAAAEYMSGSNAAVFIPDFLREIENSKNRPAISTGFNNLDRLLTGGLRKEMIVLYAVPNTGKSALVLQIADQIAERSEKDVLFVALEMSKAQHMARSVSRYTLIEANTRGQIQLAKTAVQITDGSYYAGYSPAEREVIAKAIDRYRKTGKHIYFREGMSTADQIRQAVETHKRITGNVPVIVLDYLQLIRPADSKAGIRESTEENVCVLSSIIEDLNACMIVISSVNRESYKGRLALGSAKESGLIEFSADKILALEFEKDGDPEGEKLRTPRRMQLRILKQRDGQSAGAVKFNYYPKYNYFAESV